MPEDARVISAPAALDLEVGPLMLPVLRRVAGAVGAQARMDLDGLNDLGLVVETLAAGAHRHAGGDGRVRVSATPGEGSVTLRVGPLGPGGADGLRESCTLPGVGSVLERLAGLVRSDDGDGGEYLTVRVGGDAGLGAGGPGQP
jgi:serine/threonine-protein kinase RsbW